MWVLYDYTAQIVSQQDCFVSLPLFRARSPDCRTLGLKLLPPPATLARCDYS